MVVDRLRDERMLGETRGAGLAEYILVVGLIGIVALVGFRAFGSSIDAKIGSQADCVTNLAGCDGHAASDEGGLPLLKSGKDPKFTDIDAAKDAVKTKAEGQPFIDGGDGRAIHPNDVSQGQIGDCYLVATLAAFAHRNPGVLEQGIKDNGDGTYTVTFYDRGLFGTDKVEVEVTAEFPQKDGRWVFIQPGDRDAAQSELWPMLYEKAYAQWKGGYGEIGNGGHPSDVMSAITGQSAGSDRTRGMFSDMSFSDFADTFDGNITVVGSRPDKDAKGKAVFEDGRLVSSHAYWVESVDRDKQTVTVRNPWGWNEKPITLTWDEMKQGFGTVYTTKK